MGFDHVLLRKARLAKGLSVAQLAARMQVSDQAIYDWEHGDAVPRAANMFRLGRALSVPVTRLTTGAPAPRNGGQFNSVAMIEARVRRGMSQEDVALALRVDPSSVWRWESGVTPRMARIRQLAKILRVNITDLYKVDNHREQAI
jgi:transcriptional regulator with XRE-family HTH domain